MVVSVVDIKVPNKIYFWVHTLVELDPLTMETKIVKGYAQDINKRKEGKKEDQPEEKYEAKHVGEVVL